MTKAEAIQTLLECDWLDKACKNIAKKDWEELRQRFWARILEQSEDCFCNIKVLQFYCVRIIMNEQHGIRQEAKRHTLSECFTSNYSLGLASETEEEKRIIYVDMSNIQSPEDDLESKIMINILHQKEETLGKIPMYDRVIFKLHEKGISQRAISIYTGIGRNEINKTVNRVKQYIASNVRYERTSN